MTELFLAITVGVLFSTGTYLILSRGQIRLVLGLGLLSHGINLALFGTGALTRGKLPLTPTDGSVALTLDNFADPLPQALILTAIVIGFGVTAFIVVLIQRRDALTGSDLAPGELGDLLNTADPFERRQGDGNALLPEHADDYDVTQYELDEVYDQPAEKAPREQS
jgi:multicomponent Na+:H+ antiporter subunit C